MISSRVPSAVRNQTCTASFWPIRWMREAAWTLLPGLQSASTKKTSEHSMPGPISVIDVPAARMLPTNTRQLGLIRKAVDRRLPSDSAGRNRRS